MKKNKQEILWIVASFLLLCVVSAYRQISIRYSPDDPARAVIVYVVYLLLLSRWRSAIRRRITQRNMRRFLLAEHAVMLLGVTTRFVQDALLYTDTYIMRVSGYLIIVPIILFPLFGLYASFGLGKGEEYQMNRIWYTLSIPAGILILLALTNENHHLVFRLLSNEDQANLYFHPNIGVFVIILWALLLELARILMIHLRSREVANHTHWRFTPLLVAVFMVLFNIPYLSGSFIVNYELIEYSALLFFLEAMVWESCIFVGMVPVNKHYEEVFDRSTVAMQIADKSGQPYLKSACAPEVSPETFHLLSQQSPIRTSEGKELHLHAIYGGFCVWQNDVSQTVAVINELQETAEKLEYEGELLRHELAARSEEAAIKEQNRIYNRLTDETGEQLSLIRNLLDRKDSVADKEVLFKTVCLIGTYIKRRCNLRLVEQSDGIIPNKDMELCFYELADCLRQLGIVAEVSWNTEKNLDPEFALFTFDLFERLLELEHFELDSIRAVYKSDAAFSVRVCHGGDSFSAPSLGQMQKSNSGNYNMNLMPLKKGYQVSVLMGGS